MASKQLTDRVLATCPDSYSGFNIDQLETEIIRLIKMKADHNGTKKEQARIYNDLIGEAEVKIDYCVERIDHLRHEQAVEHHLENN